MPKPGHPVPKCPIAAVTMSFTKFPLLGSESREWWSIPASALWKLQWSGIPWIHRCIWKHIVLWIWQGLNSVKEVARFKILKLQHNHFQNWSQERFHIIDVCGRFSSKNWSQNQRFYDKVFVCASRCDCRCLDVFITHTMNRNITCIAKVWYGVWGGQFPVGLVFKHGSNGCLVSPVKRPQRKKGTLAYPNPKGKLQV